MSEQISLFDIEPTPAAPARLAPGAGKPTWARYKAIAPVQCDACMCNAVELERVGRAYPPVRHATDVRRPGRCKPTCRENLRRLGVGCDHVRYFCREHAERQQRHDAGGGR